MHPNNFLFNLIFRLSFAATLVLISLGFGGCTSQKTAPTAQVEPKASPIPALFNDVAADSGLKWTHILGNSGKFPFIETTPAGCAFLDFNNDGYQDVFLVQSGSSASAKTVKNRPFCALFRNKRDGTFEDVTRGSGLDKDLGYGQGVTVGDYDNDGFDDFFITSYGGNHLFRNQGGRGQFSDETQSMGLAKVKESGYATSAAWGDYDGDGRLDLYVCYYAQWTHAEDKKCPDPVTGELDYCNPKLYEPSRHHLFRNQGNRFVDVSEKSGISKVKGRGLAAAFVDYNGDNKLDIFVANDMTPNMLWKNSGKSTFSNVSNQVGVAYDGQGQDMASMGIAIADYNRSGHPSFYVSNFADRPNILFKNSGAGTMEDVTRDAQLSLIHLKFLSFGCEFLDYDADGWPDLIANNGHVQMSQNHVIKGSTLKQRKQLMRNAGNERFEEITDAAQLGELSVPTLGRGLATGDFDNDGRLDVLAMSQNAPVQLFRNQTAKNGHHFLSLALRGTKSNRNAIGARVELKAGGATQTAWVRGGSSYLSSSDRRVYFGLGKTDKIEQISLLWPSGTKEMLRNLRADTFYTLTEGKGASISRK